MDSPSNDKSMLKSFTATLSVVVLLAIGGAAWAGCGDSNDDNSAATQGEETGKAAEESGVSTGEQDAKQGEEQGEEQGEQDAKEGEATGEKYESEYGN